MCIRDSYSVDLEQAGALIDYLVNDCCRARPDIFSGASGKDAALGALGRPYNVLFICSGNSARSIFAEAILSAVDPSRFRAFSAGTRPGTQLNPFALEVLTWAGLETSTLRSKHISEFEAADAPRMDFVFTVCDAAASEAVSYTHLDVYKRQHRKCEERDPAQPPIVHEGCGKRGEDAIEHQADRHGARNLFGRPTKFLLKRPHEYTRRSHDSSGCQHGQESYGCDCPAVVDVAGGEGSGKPVRKHNLPFGQ